MLKFPQEFSLEITNLRMDCACITVDLASITHSYLEKLAAHLMKIHIDRSGVHSVGSDHNRVKISFSSSVAVSEGHVRSSTSMPIRPSDIVRSHCGVIQPE